MSNITPYAYECLDPGGKPIRVVTIHPGLDSDEICVSIDHRDIDATSYEALSYTWGAPDQPRAVVYVQQISNSGYERVESSQQLEIRESLFVALRNIRRPDVSRVMWIDGICIDQNNIAERSQEVGRMGEIYNKATQVLVWLGPHDADTPLAFRMIKTLTAGVILDWDRRRFMTVSGSEAEVFRDHADQYPFSEAQWHSLKRFLTRPWFRRLWIRQEVTMASKITVQCGNCHMDGETLEKIGLLLEQCPVESRISTDDILFCRSLFRYHGSDNLTYNLHRSSMCGYHDPRDLVYANMSTSSEIKALGIEPDYKLSPGAVYHDLMVKHFEHFSNMDILRSCGLESSPKGFASWVLNPMIKNAESHLVHEYAHGGTRHLPITGGKEGTLHAKGRILANVDYVSESPKPLAVDKDNITQVIKAYHQWEPRELFTAGYPSGGTLLDAFIALLAGGACKEICGGAHHPTLQESKDAFLAAVWSNGSIELVSNRRVGPFAKYIGELLSDRRGEKIFHTEKGYIGTSPRAVQSGDVVCVLVGGTVPFVLRPIDTSESYLLVGPCFLQGVMYGEALLGAFPEPWICKMDRPSRQWCFDHRQGGQQTLEDPRLWPVPHPWQVHFCDMSNDQGPCAGTCAESHADENGKPRLGLRFFFNTESKVKTRYDPRLNLAGLEEGGIVLDTLTIL